MSKTKRIPYGISDYGRMRQLNGYYVDKTHYIPQIEDAPLYLFCLRPRRSGKSLLLSVLQHYYDINQAENFELLFGPLLKRIQIMKLMIFSLVMQSFSLKINYHILKVVRMFKQGSSVSFTMQPVNS